MGMKRLAKHWQERVLQFLIVHKPSMNRDALAYAHFHFSGVQTKKGKALAKFSLRCLYSIKIKLYHCSLLVIKKIVSREVYEEIEEK